MHVAITVPDATHARVEAAAARLGLTSGEFYVRAAERWLKDLDGAETTTAIDAALGDEQDTAFVGRAARDRAVRSDW